MRLLIICFFVINFNAFAKINENPGALLGQAPLNYDQSEIEEKKEIIRNIVDSYRHQIIEQRGSDVKLIFSPADVFQMTGGHVGNGKLEIKVYAKALTKFDKSGMVAAICHEVGHILGNVPLGPSAGNLADDSVEGEADYFSGICSRTFFCGADEKFCPQAISSSRAALQAMYSDPVDESLAASRIYPGINKTYPEQHCRLLSMISGVSGFIRPLCWYNPNYKPSLEIKIVIQPGNYFRDNASCMYSMVQDGKRIKQIALSPQNKICPQAGEELFYRPVEGYPNTYWASETDFLKIRNATSIAFGSNKEILELDYGIVFSILYDL